MVHPASMAGPTRLVLNIGVVAGRSANRRVWLDYLQMEFVIFIDAVRRRGVKCQRVVGVGVAHRVVDLAFDIHTLNLHRSPGVDGKDLKPQVAVFSFVCGWDAF